MFANQNSKVNESSLSFGNSTDEKIIIMEVIPEPIFIVNDKGELGVRIGNKNFYIYKGEPFKYGKYGTPPKWRKVEKREFGESGPYPKTQEWEKVEEGEKKVYAANRGCISQEDKEKEMNLILEKWASQFNWQEQ